MIFFLRTTLVILLLNIPVFSGVTYAQGTDNYNVDMPSMPYLSPEAASLGKYGDIPVSEYTGVPQIEIPLHTVKSGNLELPITLSYHASGIKVQQEATWVGLGWDLMAGGCINRIISGEYDEYVSSMVSEEDWQLLLSENPGIEPYAFEHSGFFGEPAPDNISHSMLFELSHRRHEPDLFQANFCGHSFTFYVHPHTGDIVITGKENGNYKIERTPVFGHITDWKITDNTGIEYFFEEKGTESIHTQAYQSSFISSWFITKMKHPIKGEITFVYENNQSVIHVVPPIFESQTRSTDAGVYIRKVLGYDPNPSQMVTTDPQIPSIVQSSIQYFDADLYKRYLKEIVTESEKVMFCAHSARSDISGDARSLDTIRVISLMNDSEVKKSILFNYSYFTSDSSGNECSLYNGIITGDRKIKRLRLDSLHVNDQKYGFSYNNQILLPKKTSYSQDFWGYYNGKNNSSLLCTANVRERAQNPTALVLGNANRFVDTTYIQAGMLTAITYPTGGRSEFSFESNTFVDKQHNEWYPLANNITHTITQSLTTHVAYANQNSSASDKKKQFVIQEPTNVHIAFSTRGTDSETNIHSAYGRLQRVFPEINDTILLHSFSVPNVLDHNYYNDSLDTLLSSGTYEIMADFMIPPYLGTWDDETHSTVTISYIEKYNNNSITYNGINYGGGLRIREIRNYDEDNNLTSTTSYEYTQDDGSTSGINMLPLPRIDDDVTYIKGSIIIPCYQECFFHMWFTNTINSAVNVNTFTSLNSVPVGYSQVTVTKNDSRTVSKYYNWPPIDYEHLKKGVAYDNLLNGTIKERNIFSRNGTLYQRQLWDYELLVDSTTTINAYAKDFAMGAEVSLDEYGLDNFMRYRIIIYPFINQRIVSSSEICETRRGNSAVRDSVSYIYDNKYQPSLITKATEHAGVNETVSVKYPYDTAFSNVAVYDSMLCRNMLSYPIETIKSVGGQTVSRSRNDYSLQNNLPLLTSRKWAQGSQQYMERIAMRYDSIGNCIEAMRNDGEPVTYLWSYRNTLPVAKIEGMGYDDVVSIISSSVNTALINSVLPGDTILQSIRNSLSGHDVLVTTYTYDPLVGILSETAPNGETTTYEYDSIGRLIRVKDHRGKTINSYEYNYAH